MTRIAWIALLVSVVGAPALAHGPLSVTVSDRTAPIFVPYAAATATVDPTGSSRDWAQDGAHSPRAAAIFAQLAAESIGD